MITPMQELSRKDDAYIFNILNDKKEHSIEYLQAATLIFEERNLSDPNKQALIKKYPYIKNEIRDKVNEGTDPNSILQELLSKGMSNQDAEHIIAQAVKIVEADRKIQLAKKSKIWTLIILFLLGILTRYLVSKYAT